MIEKYGIEPVRKAVRDLYMILCLYLEKKGFLPDGEDENFGPENEVEEEVLGVVYKYINLNASLFRCEDNKFYPTESTPKDFISIENFWKAIMIHDAY